MRGVATRHDPISLDYYTGPTAMTLNNLLAASDLPVTLPWLGAGVAVLAIGLWVYRQRRKASTRSG